MLHDTVNSFDRLFSFTIPSKAGGVGHPLKRECCALKINDEVQYTTALCPLRGRLRDLTSPPPFLGVRDFCMFSNLRGSDRIEPKTNLNRPQNFSLVATLCRELMKSSASSNKTYYFTEDEDIVRKHVQGEIMNLILRFSPQLSEDKSRPIVQAVERRLLENASTLNE